MAVYGFTQQSFFNYDKISPMSYRDCHANWAIFLTLALIKWNVSKTEQLGFQVALKPDKTKYFY